MSNNSKNRKEISPTKEWTDNPLNTPSNNKENINNTTTPVSCNSASSYEDIEDHDYDNTNIRWKKTNSARRKSRRRSSLLSAKKARSAQKALRQEAEVAAASVASSASPIVKKNSPKSATNSSKVFSKPKTIAGGRSSLLLPTACSSIKQRKKVVLQQNSNETNNNNCPRELTKPKSPQFKIEQRLKATSKSQQLTSEDIMIIKLQQEKEEKNKEIMRARKLYESLRTKSVSSTLKTTTKKTGRRETIGNTSISSSVPLSASKPQMRRRITGQTPRAMRRRSLEGIVKKYGGQSTTTVKSRTTATALFGKPKKLTKTAATPRQPTISQPFNFATDKRCNTRKAANNDVKTIPTAELVEKFTKDTRSHEVPAHAAEKLTICHSPKLRTRTRSANAMRGRAPIPTYEEKEEEVMNEIRKHPFKARPVDPRIFESTGELGVPKVATRPLTEPKGFELQTEKRIAKHAHEPETPSSPNKGFKARPMPEYVRDASKAPPLPAPVVPKLTEAHSPKMSGGARASSAPAHRQKPHHTEVEKKQQLEKQRAIAYVHEPMASTESKPFNLATSSRGEMHKQQLLQRIQQEEEELNKLREHRAMPVPDYAALNAALNAKMSKTVEKRELTQQKPFQLISEKRHSVALQQFEKEVEALEEEKRKGNFHAKPLPKTTYEPQVYVLPQQEKLLPMPVEMESDRRAAKRQEFDKIMSQRVAELDILKEQLRLQQKAEEEQEVKMLRRKSVQEGGMNFKANPIIKHDPFPTKKPAQSRPLTVAKSPELSSKTRSRSIGGLSSASVDNINFKARPLNRRIFESTGELGVPKINRRKTTEPKSFEFRTDERISVHNKKKEVQAANKDTANRTSNGGLRSGARRVTNNMINNTVENSETAPPTINAKVLRSAMRAKVIAEKKKDVSTPVKMSATEASAADSAKHLSPMARQLADAIVAL